MFLSAQSSQLSLKAMGGSGIYRMQERRIGDSDCECLCFALLVRPIRTRTEHYFLPAHLKIAAS